MSDTALNPSLQELPKIASLGDIQSPPLPTVTPIITSPHTEPTNSVADIIDTGTGPIPSSKRSMRHQSSAMLTTTPKKMGSMDSLIDSLRPASGTPSSSKGKSKAVEVQASASTSDVQAPLPDYLVPPPSKKETVDTASKRADANLSLVDSKIDGVQALLSEEVREIRTHLAQLAADVSLKAVAHPDHASHTTISNLITSHNKVVETVRDLNGHIASLISSSASVNTRLDSFETALAALDPIRTPAEKRSRYEDVPISTLVPMPPSIHSEVQHVGNFPAPYPNAPTMMYPSPNAQAIPNPPSHGTRSSSNNRHRAVQLGPMNWVNHRDEVHALLNMVPAFNSVNKRGIQVNPSAFAHYVRITFGSSSDATAFTRIWNTSRPQQFSSVSVSYTSEN